MTYKALYISSVSFLVLLLSACGKQADVPAGSARPAFGTNTSSTNGVSNKSTGTDEEQAIKKMNSYVKSHNGLLGMFYGSNKGLKELLRAYEAQNIPKKTNVDPASSINLYLNLSIVRNSLDDLRIAKDIKGNNELAKLEQIGAKLLTNGDLLLAKGSDLENYFKSKKYLDDNLAKAKTEHVEFIALWQSFIDNSDAFSDELDVVERTRRIAAVKRLRSEGNNRLAANEEAMLASSEILALFNNNGDFKNLEKIKAADALALQLEKVTNEIKIENDKTKDGKSTSYTRVYEQMNSFMGAYRTVKATGESRQFDEMLRHYNSAVREQRSLN